MSIPTGPTKDPQASLAWYHHLWLGLPMLLVAIGGAIGGACGGAAWALNQKVFRETRNPVLRYVWTGLISVSALVVYLLVAVAILSVIGRNR